MEHVRHIIVVLIGAGVAVTGARLHACDEKLFMIAAAIIAGEYGLAQAMHFRNKRQHRKSDVS